MDGATINGQQIKVNEVRVVALPHHTLHVCFRLVLVEMAAAVAVEDMEAAVVAAVMEVVVATVVAAVVVDMEVR